MLSFFSQNLIVLQFAFVFEVLFGNDWHRIGLLHINSNLKLGNDSYLIPEEGIVPIAARNDKLVANFVLHSVKENDMRVLILTTGHVVVNYTNYNLRFWSFAIQTNERETGLKVYENMASSLYATDKTSPSSYDAKGTPITLFSCVTSPKTKYKSNTTYNYFLTLFNESPENYSCPILLNRKFKRKSFSVLCGDSYIPFIASILRHQDQLYLSIYEDPCPSLTIENQTDFNIFVGQSTSINTTKNPNPAEDCSCDDKFQWYQQVPSKKLVYYTPPIIDQTFPEIDSFEYALIFACVSSTNSGVKWSQPVKIDENKEVFLDIPLYGDIKVSVNTSGKTSRVILDYIRQVRNFEFT